MTHSKIRSSKFRAITLGLTALAVVGLVFVAGHRVSASANAADDASVVSVASTTPVGPPVVTLNGDATMSVVQGSTFTDPGATAVDGSGTDISSSIVETGSIDTSTPATYTLTYTATDSSNQTGSATRTVTVTPTATTTDTTIPDISLGGTPPVNVGNRQETCNFASTVNTDSGPDVDDTAATSTAVTPINSAWLPSLTTNPNAIWIWGDTLTDQEAQTGSSYTFTTPFWVTGATPTGTLVLAADNTYTVSVNGTAVDVSDQDPGGANFGSTHTYDISSDLQAGQVNTLTITVTNIAVPGSTALSNPAGLMFGLKVSGDTCSGVSKVFIRKFLQTTGSDGTQIKQVPNDSTFPDFPMTATWTAPNLDGGVQSSGSYPLGENYGGAVHKFAARTSYMAHPYDYTTSEVTGGDSPVVASQDSCAPGKFYLVGYKTGDNIADALASNTLPDAPQLTDETGHNVIVVINAECPAAPKECTLVSDTGTLANTGQGVGHQPSVLVSTINPAWTALLDGASWIWGEDPITQYDAVHGKTEVFTKSFHLDAVPSDATLTIAADNEYTVLVNGVQVAQNLTEFNYTAAGQATIDIPAADLVQGANKMVITVTNMPMVGGTPATNPAGLLYTLTINGADCGTGGNNNPTLTIVKDTTGGDGTFPFTVAPVQSGEDTVQPDSKTLNITTTDGTGSSDVINLNPGDYDVTENIPDGWNLTGVNCVYNGGDEGSSITNGEEINVDKGDSVVCTFNDTNTSPTTGTLIIDKSTVNGDGTFSFNLSQGDESNQEIDVTTTDGSGNTSTDVASGSYSVTEDPQQGWTLTGTPSCSDSEGPIGTPNDDGIDGVVVNPGDTVTCTFANTASIVTNNTGGGNNGSGGGTSGGRIGNPVGQVLGASTSNVPPVGQVLGAECSPILTSYLRIGRPNPASQVKILQNFLNGNLGINLPITGFFGKATYAAVSAFQTKYGSSVLAPWVPFGLHSATDPTGYVYKTTKYEINYLACPTNGASNPVLP